MIKRVKAGHVITGDLKIANNIYCEPKLKHWKLNFKYKRIQSQIITNNGLKMKKNT